jgi:hypothetical protein
MLGDLRYVEKPTPRALLLLLLRAFLEGRFLSKRVVSVCQDKQVEDWQARGRAYSVADCCSTKQRNTLFVIHTVHTLLHKQTCV